MARAPSYSMNETESGSNQEEIVLDQSDTDIDRLESISDPDETAGNSGSVDNNSNFANTGASGSSGSKAGKKSWKKTRKKNIIRQPPTDIEKEESPKGAVIAPHQEASTITKLIEEGREALGGGNLDGAKQLALKAMIVAEVVLNSFVQDRETGVQGQQLADWFGECAHILHQTKSYFPAAKCFYTATVFDANWNVADHRNVSRTLWDAILADQYLHEKREKVFTGLDHAFEMAKLAFTKRLYKLCSVICNDVDFVYFNLFFFKLVRPRNSQQDPQNAYFASVKQSVLYYARCQYYMKNYTAVKAMCAKVLYKMCDYDCSEALELWGLSLLQEENYEVALLKIQLALKYARDDASRSRLNDLHEEISEKQKALEKKDSEVDRQWLSGTAAVDMEKLYQKQQPRTKTSDSAKPLFAKPKPRQLHKYDRYKETKQPEITTLKKTDNDDDMVSIYTTDSKFLDPCAANMKGKKGPGSSSKLGKRKTYNKERIYKEYRCGHVSSDTDEESEQKISSVIHISDEPPKDTIEEETFYERSVRLLEKSETTPDMDEVVIEQLLENGVKLNLSYLCQFEDKDESHYNRDPYYEDPLSKEMLQHYLTMQDEYLHCELQIESAHLAYCKPLDPSCNIEKVEISGRSKTGQAFNGDEVLVKLLDNHREKDKRYGKVVGVLNRKKFKNIKHPVFLCTLDDMASHLMRPICRTIPKISILNQEIMEKWPRLRKYKIEIYDYDERLETLCDPEIVDVDLGHLQRYVFLVAFISWSRRHVYPRGAVIKMLSFGESLTEGQRLLNFKYAIPSLYNKDVVCCVQNKGLEHFDEIDTDLYSDRDDLTSLKVFTIDPPGSKDLDDALSIQKIEDGFEVGVHIADVSQLVERGDPIDKEAGMRTTTFYPSLSGKLPRSMLPEPLSRNACSLLPNKQRLALSLFFRLSKTGQLIYNQARSIQFKPSVIKSCRQFTYREIQDVIDGKEDALKQEIVWLHTLSKHIRRKRLGNAMMALDLEQEDDITEDSLFETYEAHFLVEEFMIMANRAVAERLLKEYPDRIPLRCQKEPMAENMKQFIEKHGEFIDASVRLQDKKICSYKTPSLDSLLGTADQGTKFVIVPKSTWGEIKSNPETAAKLLCIDSKYPLQQLVRDHWIEIQNNAEYKCSGNDRRPKDLRHFDLQMYPYTHFTSPIRRYIDLIVHRMLHAALAKQNCPYSREEIVKICSRVNIIRRNAKRYERNCKMLKFAVELKKIPKMVDSFVDDLSDRCITLTSPNMKHMLRDNKELPFNLLDMGFKPELTKDKKTNKDVLTATWKKRLYDINGEPESKSYERRDKRLNANQEVVFIPLQKWARLVKCAVEDRKEDLARAISSTNNIVQIDGTANDVITEWIGDISIEPNVTFSLQYRQGQMVKLQLTAVPLKGMLTPRPMLYNMTNNVKLCLQHTDDPVLFLSKYSNKATCDQYRHTNMYLERWIPLIHMEAATCSASSEESFVINNIPVTFDNVRHGRFKLSLAFCEIRNISFSGSVLEDSDGDDDDDESFQAYDWLCLRYVDCVTESATPKRERKAMKPVWIGHAEITGVTKKLEKGEKLIGKVSVKFRLHELCPSLPPSAARKGSKFCIEVLRKSEVDRRTESFVKRMEHPAYTDTLAVKIALNRKIPPLDKLHVDMANTIERDMYVKPGQSPFPLPRNNSRQQEAVDKALRNRLTLIQGPPGTGKTYTGIKLMYLFDRINSMIHREHGGERHQILFCGPSNKSVDLVGRWMKQKLGCLCPNFVRIYGKAIESIDFPIPGRTFLSKKSTRALRTDKELRSLSLHHLIRMKDKPYAEEINSYDRMFKDKNYVVPPETVLDYVKLLDKAAKEEIKIHNVILCTTAVGSNPKVLKASKVYQVIVDEAGMCPEPQCLMPIIATKAEQVVLIGDHKQLRPIIICKQAAELGLQTSLFERYALCKHSSGVEFTMLNKQYRMNPELCRFPSEEFYEGKLKTMKAAAWTEDNLETIWPQKNGIRYPHVLIHVQGEEKSLTVSTDEGNEHSRSNLQEIDVVMKLFRYFINNGIEGQRMNVISQYNAQCSLIKERMQKEGFKNYNVSTVVSSQGGEWDYVIFSAVRSLPDYRIERNPTIGWCQQNLGFITDENQINVALTRARKGLIVVGNIQLLRCDKVWRHLITTYERDDCIKKIEEFPRQKTRLQMMEEADQRNWQRYGDERFVPGHATSYEGNFDIDDDSDDDEDEDGFTKVRRGRYKMLRSRKQ